jgi:hypothetical protein
MFARLSPISLKRIFAAEEISTIEESLENDADVKSCQWNWAIPRYTHPPIVR